MTLSKTIPVEYLSAGMIFDIGSIDLSNTRLAILGSMGIVTWFNFGIVCVCGFGAFAVSNCRPHEVASIFLNPIDKWGFEIYSWPSSRGDATLSRILGTETDSPSEGKLKSINDKSTNWIAARKTGITKIQNRR